MNLIDKLTVPFFGTIKEDQKDVLVFYPFGNRQKPHVLKSEDQVWALRNVTAMLFVVVLMLVTGAISFAGALLFLKSIDPRSIYMFGLNMFWLLLIQPVLLGVAVAIYDRIVRGILKA